MIAYIQRLVRDMIPRFQFADKERLADISDRVRALAEELDRLDPRDFVPEGQFEFVEARLQVRRMARPSQPYWVDAVEMLWASRREQEAANADLAAFQLDIKTKPGVHSDPENMRQSLEKRLSQATQLLIPREAEFRDATQVCERVDRVLDLYAGAGSQAVTRSFAFVSDPDLRAIVERDYKQLTQSLLPGMAWKSAVVMAGSILEAILYDLLIRDPHQIAAAMGSKVAPRYKGVVRDIMQDTYENEWKLVDLIRVSVDLGLLPPERADTIDQVLRDYRNFVHPRKELRAQHPCTEAEATLAKGALDAICNHLA